MILYPGRSVAITVPDIITALNDIHFIALHAAEDFQLGADLLFWHQFAQAIKGIIAKDQYIPALKYRAISSTQGKGKKAKTISSFELHPAWELLSDTYETTIQRYVASMPGVCTAGMNSPDDTALFGKESLLRHFSECLLHNIVTGTPFTGKFDQQIADTLLYKCVYPYRPVLSQASADPLKDYKDWLAWRANFTRAHTEAGFTLCFRLEEASPANNENWQLHFLVAARHDPSLKLNLDDYWHLKPKDRAEAVRPFGQDFEKNLLLASGVCRTNLSHDLGWDGYRPPDRLHSYVGRGVHFLEGKCLGTWRRGLHGDRPSVVDTRRTPAHEGSPQNVSAFAQRHCRDQSRPLQSSVRLFPTSISCRLGAR